MDAPLKKRKLTFESELDDGGGGDVRRRRQHQ